MNEKRTSEKSRDLLVNVFVFIFSLLFCYFAAAKNSSYAFAFLFAVFLLFEKIRENKLLMLKIVSPFFVVPIAFYHKFLGILGLITAVPSFSIIYVLGRTRKINAKKVERLFFGFIFLIYLMIELLTARH